MKDKIWRRQNLLGGAIALGLALSMSACTGEKLSTLGRPLFQVFEKFVPGEDVFLDERANQRAQNFGAGGVRRDEIRGDRVPLFAKRRCGLACRRLHAEAMLVAQRMAMDAPETGLSLRTSSTSD